MKKSLSLVLIAVLAFGIGIAYAAPMLIAPVDIQLYPTFPEGSKAQFTVDTVYAKFDTVNFEQTCPVYNEAGEIVDVPYPAVNISYNVVLKVTNTADTPATLYQLTFAAAQNATVRDSILGGTIIDTGARNNYSLCSYRHFGAVINGIYLDNKWVNTTWIPDSYNIYEGSNIPTKVPYPASVHRITQAQWEDSIIPGPLRPRDVAAFSVDHSLNGTIPQLPDNASEKGTWIEGVPLTEYYDPSGNPLVTMMYINGTWVDVTGKVTTGFTLPMLTTTNTLVNEVLSLGAQPYENIKSTVGPFASLPTPTWGDWGIGGVHAWFPWDWEKQPFNNTFAPHESRLLSFNHTQLFIMMNEGDAPSKGLTALENGNIAIYASASNYITNQPINGTFFNTVSTATQVKNLQLEHTADGYIYSGILADGQKFQQGNASLEVTVAPRTQP